MFSITCSARLAPVITLLTFGLVRHQASPSCASVQSSSFAIGWSCLTLATRSGVITDSFSQP
jgi:hypothetical protein